ncbi:ribosome silencing factor [Roseovarius sp. S1116L3]|uniref:ribosome silencing factor n=1 Tax=Roseovarius roseus TaxID=3342636 RepID=UPI00372999F6
MAIFRIGPAPGQDQVRSQEDDVLSISAQAADAATTTTAGTQRAPSDTATSQEQLQHILASLEADKAEDIVQVDLRGKSAIGDYMVICSGRSSRQVSAIAEKLVDKLKHDLGRASRIEGRETGDWVLIDTGDVIVHVFRPEVREFYQLEKMWVPAGGPSSEVAPPTSPG